MNWEWGVSLILRTHLPHRVAVCSVPIAALTASIYITLSYLYRTPARTVFAFPSTPPSAPSLAYVAFRVKVHTDRRTRACISLPHTSRTREEARADYSRRNNLPRFERNWRRTRRFLSIWPNYAKRKAIQERGEGQKSYQELFLDLR